MIVDRIPVVDADTHLTEPADLWVERVPSKYADIVPRVVVSAAGREVWLIGDKMVQGAAATSAAGLDEYWPDYPKTLAEVDAAAQERHLSLNFHIGFGGFDNTLGVSAFPSRSRRRTAQGQEELAMFRADLAKVSTLGLISNSRAIVEVLISGICDRFPSLNFV